LQCILSTAEIALRKYGFTLPDRGLACIPYDSDEGQDYLAAMNCALNFAWCNRQMIMHWTRKAFEKVFGRGKEKQEYQQLDMKLVYDVAHNIAKIERHSIEVENGGGSIRNLMVHRKGATSLSCRNGADSNKAPKYRPTSNNTRFNGYSKLVTFR
jgi:tRNA-splicing ligase RtcB